MHYRLHLVLGFGRYKKRIHKIFTNRKIPKPRPAGHYYVTLKIS